jgi:hypothetical protein
MRTIKPRRMSWTGHRKYDKWVQNFSEKFWWEYATLGDVSEDRRMILKSVSQKSVGLCLRIGTSGGIFWTWCWTFGFQDKLVISWWAVRMLASQGGLCCMSLVCWLVTSVFHDVSAFSNISCLWGNKNLSLNLQWTDRTEHRYGL